MLEEKTIRLSKAAKELNISIPRIIEFLAGKGHKIDHNPNGKIGQDIHTLLMKEFQPDMLAREESEKKAMTAKLKKEAAEIAAEQAKALAREKEAEEAIIKNMKPVEVEVIPEVVVPAPPPVVIEEPKVIKAKGAKMVGPTVIDKIDLDALNTKTKPDKKKKGEAPKAPEVAPAPVVVVPAPVAEVPAEPVAVVPEVPVVETPAKPEEPFRLKRDKLAGPTVIRTIPLPAEPTKTKHPGNNNETSDQKKRRKRRPGAAPTSTPAAAPAPGTGASRPIKPAANYSRPATRSEPSEKEIQDQIRQTLARLSGGTKSKSAKYRKLRRAESAAHAEEQQLEKEAQKSILRVTEFLSANELSKMMNVQVTDVIKSCLALGLFVSINQRLDADTITIVAEEFGYKVSFTTIEDTVTEEELADSPESLSTRPPIVTVMGHVDHGKTSLLDYIRKTNVIAGEAGGITQHIGAYEVTLDSGKQITFLDTPGHEAFTAMRARGAKVTDVAIIVVAADDSVMPQTIEAINHAQAAGVPIVFAINKIDKPGANSEKIKERLSQMNILVEDWGGKFQCQEISAKKGLNIDSLLEKVLLEAEMLELTANANKNGIGTVIESTLDKGRGYVTTVLVQTGTLKIGDVILAGSFSGKVKAMFNERGVRTDSAGPSTPVLVLGLSGAPQAGDTFKVMDDERQAREMASKRTQLVREQGIRTHKHITLDEIGRRLKLGNFKELNIIVKGDVDGSVEALSDSLLKLSNQEIQVNVIHKSVGQISESDVLLATASEAIIIGFQVRPSLSARKLAENEEIDIRLYSIIYDAINEIKAAMEGMLSPEFVEKIICNLEIRQVFTVTKSGTIAGCMVLDGKITRQTKIRVVRNGIVIHSGDLSNLKRFKDDVKDVASGYECGLSINNFNGMEEGDIIEGYENVEVKRKI